MKKLSEYTDGDALDMIADMLGPIVSMTKNEEFMNIMNDKEATRLDKVQTAIKACKPEVMNILAILNGVPLENYHCSIASILIDLSSLLSDKDFTDFFESQGQKSSEDAFGSAMGNTEETGN